VLSDNLIMAATYSVAHFVVRLTIAGLKRAKSAVRGVGIGASSPDSHLRAATCAACLLSVRQCGKLYCGKPLLRQLERDEATEGCGCPIALKAADPAEHCPRTDRFAASTKADATTCDCLWCAAGRRSRDARGHTLELPVLAAA
jgi:hypothetical protein